MLTFLYLHPSSFYICFFAPLPPPPPIYLMSIKNIFLFKPPTAFLFSNHYASSLTNATAFNYHHDDDDDGPRPLPSQTSFLRQINFARILVKIWFAGLFFIAMIAHQPSDPRPPRTIHIKESRVIRNHFRKVYE